jgi:hypothetical protein
VVVLKILAAGFLLVIFLFLCLVGLGLLLDFIKRITQKKGQDTIIGDFTYWGNVAEAKIKLEKNLEVTLNFPLSENDISLAVREVIRKLKNYPAEMKGVIEQAAIAEFDEIRDAYKGSDEWATIRSLDGLKGKAGAFLEEFEIVRIEITEDPDLISIEYLTPWDPEHTRSATLNFNLQLESYGLTCADGNSTKD